MVPERGKSVVGSDIDVSHEGPQRIHGDHNEESIIGGARPPTTCFSLFTPCVPLSNAKAISQGDFNTRIPFFPYSPLPLLQFPLIIPTIHIGNPAAAHFD